MTTIVKDVRYHPAFKKASDEFNAEIRTQATHENERRVWRQGIRPTDKDVMRLIQDADALHESRAEIERLRAALDEVHRLQGLKGFIAGVGMGKTQAADPMLDTLEAHGRHKDKPIQWPVFFPMEYLEAWNKDGMCINCGTRPVISWCSVSHHCNERYFCSRCNREGFLQDHWKKEAIDGVRQWLRENPKEKP